MSTNQSGVRQLPFPASTARYDAELSDKGRIKICVDCHSDQRTIRTLTRRLFRCLRSSHDLVSRQFLTGVGVLAAVSGTAGRVWRKR